MALDVEAVLQAQRAELVVAQFAGKITLGLAATLGNAGLDTGVVVVVVFVQGVSLSEDQLAADQQQYGGEQTAQGAFGHPGGEMGAERNARERTDQERNQQHHIDRA